jgi:MAP3K TRAFs-binding domain
VRLEIEAAVARNVRVIPVLVDRARMPRAADLPASLEGLARRQALELDPASFDTSRLLRMLDSTLAGTDPADPADARDVRTASDQIWIIVPERQYCRYSSPPLRVGGAPAHDGRSSVPDPIAFMVMPFGRRPTDRSEAGVPPLIDFDTLWFRVYRPVLQDLGYQPARADADVGSLIVTAMIQRLVLGDLVVADLTLPNANVYYEVGVRHAARKTGCVLAAADWARPLFDLAQMRQVRFPLANGLVDEWSATTARAHLAEGMKKLLEAASPVFDGVPGYPSESDPQRVAAFADLAEELMSFDSDVREAYLVPQAERRTCAVEVLERYGHKPAVREADSLLILRMLRDLVDWNAVLDYIGTLPAQIAHHPEVMEQECLAMAKATTPGAAVKAAARLEMLIAKYGETSERFGLLGGRYKQLANEASDEAERRRYIDKAISSYERGMMVDLNDYYPASNLPRLYRKRGRDGDEKLAAEAEVITMAACQRALARKMADEWVRPTLLGLAFDRGDVAKAQQLLTEVAAEGPVVWKIQTTLSDLQGSIDGHADEKVRRQLSGVLTALKGLLPPVSPSGPGDKDSPT